MKHIDVNSLKLFGVCALLSLFGIHGVAAAVYASLTKEWSNKNFYGHWCWFGILFDTLGCSGGMAVHWWIFHKWYF